MSAFAVGWKPTLTPTRKRKRAERKLMKIKIRYEYEQTVPPHFFAKSDMGGNVIMSCGDSWEEARKRQLEKLAKIVVPQNIPPPEEIDTELLK
jgi:hypothetical protein